MISSERKKILRRICRIIVIIFLIFITVSAVSTKLVYDCIFPRFDYEKSTSDFAVTDSFSQMKFRSGNNNLQGYFYDNKGKTLIVVVPGFKASVEDYFCQIQDFLKLGYSVFTFDSTGHYRSEGNSSVGFSQELLDLDCALDYIESNNNFGCENIVLFGHSRGGYSSCCILSYGHDISAVVSVAGINSAMEGIMAPSVSVAGNFAYGNYPFLWLYQTMIFGADVVNKSASDEISKSDIPVMIIQGSNDEIVPQKAYSIYSHKNEITNRKTEFELFEEKGHTDILFDSRKNSNKKLIKKVDNFFRKSTVKHREPPQPEQVNN